MKTKYISMLFLLIFIFNFCIFTNVFAEDEEPVTQSCLFDTGYALIESEVKDSEGDLYRNYKWTFFKGEGSGKEELVSGSTGSEGMVKIYYIDPFDRGADYTIEIYNSQGEVIGYKEKRLECGEKFNEDIELNELKLEVKRYDDFDLAFYKNFKVYKKDEDKTYEKGELVYEGEIDRYGKALMILPESDYTIEIPFIESEMHKVGNYYVYGVALKNGNQKEISYTMTKFLNLRVRDKDNVNVTNKKVEIYELEYDENDNSVLGTLLKKDILSSDRNVVIPYPGKNYTVKFTNPSGLVSYYSEVEIGKEEGSIDENSARLRVLKLGSLEFVEDDEDDPFRDNIEFNLYLQEKDEDNGILLTEKIASQLLTKEDRVYTLAPGEYTAEIIPGHVNEKRYYINNITIKDDKATEVVLPTFNKGMAVSIINADTLFLPDISYSVYHQDGDNLGYAVGNAKMTEKGEYVPFFPDDPFVVLVEGDGNLVYRYDDQRFDNPEFVYNPYDDDERLTLKEYKLEFIRVFILDEKKDPVRDFEIVLNLLKKSEDGIPLFDKQVVRKKTNQNGYVDFYVPYGMYEILIGSSSQIVRLEPEQKVKLIFDYITASQISEDEVDLESLDHPVAKSEDYLFSNSLLGQLLLQVEDGGRIWYVNPLDSKRYEVTFKNALSLFKNFALGISNKNLITIKQNFDFIDQSIDSDDDGYTDYVELKNLYDPYGKGRFSYDSSLTDKLTGRLLLQVEDGGRIWYVNSRDNLMYEVTWSNLVDLFTKLSLGISNSDLEKIEIGNI